MNKYKQLLLNTGLFAVNAVATKLITFFLIPLYTYYMSSGEYGVTDMAYTVINFAIPLATICIAEAAIRFIIGDARKKNEYVVISVLITFLSIIVVALISPILNLQVFGGLGSYQYLFIFLYACSAFMHLCGEIARSMGEVKLIPICAVISSIITFIFAYFLIAQYKMSVVGYFISSTIGPLVAICIYMSVGGLAKAFGIGIIHLIKCTRKEIWNIVHPMLRYAIPLMPDNLFWWMSNGINRLFITGMLGIASSGMFAVASKIPSLLTTVYVVFQQAWQLSAYQESDDKEVGKFFSSVFCVLQMLCSTVCAILSLLSPYLASILLQGESYAAWPMISILLLSNLFGIFTSFYGTVYSTTMHTAFIMKTTMYGAIASVIFTPMLIPFFGTIGACISLVLGQILIFSMRVLDSGRYIRIEVGWHYLLPVLILLTVQAIMTTWQITHWFVVSAICTLLIILIQLIRLFTVLPKVRVLGAQKR